ncbi:MAG: DUF5684 domain-containing protein [Candidatus Zixiibacteriota bacterium]
MESASDALGGTFMLVMLVGVYIFFALALSSIATKLGHSEHAWWGWVPIMNTFLLVELAGRPLYWFIFLLIPVANIVVFAMLWMDVAKKRGMSAFLGFLCLIPVVQFISMGLLAWGNGATPDRFPAGSQPLSRGPVPSSTGPGVPTPGSPTSPGSPGSPSPHQPHPPRPPHMG